MNPLRKNLPPLPSRIATLPVDERGYPIPWFVATAPDGSRDFRVACGKKRKRAVQLRLCWLCGEKIGRRVTFVIGPMCVVNRNTSEPPCHRDCAEFAVKACPFLLSPKAQYRRAGLPETATGHAGSIPGNPGAAALYVTESFMPYNVPKERGGGWLIRVGDPLEVAWWAEGKPASRAQIMDSLESRIHNLRDVAMREGPRALAHLAAELAEAEKWLPDA